MTSAPESTRLDFGTLEGAITAMRERGLRLSTVRRLILEELFAADGPVSAELVGRRLNLDPASVYRNLEMLERHGLVRHVHLGHGPGLYVLIGRGEREYLYCDRCGAVTTVDPEQLEPVRARVLELFGYRARFTHFAIVGLCAGCAAGEDGVPAAEHSHHDRVHVHTSTEPHGHQH